MNYAEVGRYEIISSIQTEDPPRALGWMCVALGSGLALNSILGPLLSHVIKYRYGTSMINQAIGLDAVALCLAAPLALVAAFLVFSEHQAGPIIAFAPALFAMYMMPQYVIGPDYLGIAGNNQRFAVFHLVLFILAGATFLRAWSSVQLPSLEPRSGTSDQRRSWILLGVAVFIAVGRWLPALVNVMGDRPTNETYLDNPTAFWLIAFLDLGIVVPAAVFTAVALRQHRSWARRSAYAIIGWFSLVPASVAAMAITMDINNDPLSTRSNTIILTTAAFVFSVAAALLFRPMFRPRESFLDSTSISKVRRAS